MKKPNFILLINRVHTLLVIAAIGLLASCSKAELQEENNAEPPKSGSMYAVSYDEAVAELESLLADIDTPTKGKSPRKVANYYTTTLSEAQTKSNADDPFIYIFNFENNEGFAILSGDKRTTPVYAITESGSLNPGDTITNPGLGIALMGIYDDIWGTIDKDPPGDNITIIQSPYRNSVYTGNFCDIRWKQGKPYNKFCPNQYPVGCVAVAVAQIMFYHNYPYSYNSYTFDWNRIRLDPYYSPENASTFDMVARLMQQLGLPQNLNTVYQSDNSWAFDEDVPRTFRNFGYSSGGTISDYNFDLLKADIAKGRPVYVSGAGIKIKLPLLPVKYDNGHAWVIDCTWERESTITTYRNGVFDNSYVSYDKFVRCNWGWGETANGYYYSGIFNTNSPPKPNNVSTKVFGEENNFQFNIKMITGIIK